MSAKLVHIVPLRDLFIFPNVEMVRLQLCMRRLKGTIPQTADCTVFNVSPSRIEGAYTALLARWRIRDVGRAQLVVRSIPIVEDVMTLKLPSPPWKDM